MLTRYFFLLVVGAQGANAFLSQPNQAPSALSSTLSPTALSMAVMSYDDMLTRVDHYEVTVPKPLGVVFGENPDPYFGLVVDDVSEGLNGGMAGLRKGDQLLAINEQIVVGKEFDTVMGLLQAEPRALNIIMYRGPVSQLFTVLANQLEDGESIFDDEDEYEGEESEEVIMDESYESPVRIEVKEQKPLTPGDFVKAFGKVAGMLGDSLKADPNEGQSEGAGAPPPPKKKTGFFGIGAESVQLDGNEARGYRAEKIEPDEF